MFFEGTDEFEAVFLLSAEQADRRFLTHIVHIIGGLENFVVLGNCTIICIDHSFDDTNTSGVSGCDWSVSCTLVMSKLPWNVPPIFLIRLANV